MKTTEPVAVQCTDVARQYAPGRGVDGVSLTVRAGESIALLGRNGSGKSTLTRMLLGIERPDRGMMRVLGYDPAAPGRPHLASTGVCLDAVPHWEKLTGRENARFVAHASKTPPGGIESRIDTLFALAGLAEQANDAVWTWSFGMRRKLGLVEAMINDPALLVLDEPTSGVDPQFLLRLADLIRERSRTGRTTWIAGNDPDWVAGVATHIAFMDKGGLVALGTVAELTALVADTQEILVALAGPVTLPPLGGNGIVSFDQQGMMVRVLAAGDPAAVMGVLQWIVRHGGSPRRVEIHGPSIRDAFLMKTGTSLDT